MIDLLILGASGALAKTMVSPAIEKIIKDRNNIRPIGFGRSPKPEWWRWKYVQANYEQVDMAITDNETIIYLALPIKIEVIKDIVKSLKKVRKYKNNWKIAIEKPFGTSLEEAKQIKKELETIFDDKQIFPVDHYLTKDLVKNIVSFRFANPIIEQVWKGKNIESIKITAWEKEGVGDRGEYYDKSGAIKDMVQNHLLQLLALTTINRPDCLNGDCLQQAKLDVLKEFLVEDVEMGQYKGYRSEKHVDKKSKTETMAKVSLKIDVNEWSDVPVLLQTGKKQNNKLTEIEVVFKPNLACLWQDKCAILPKNRIVINLYPDNEIRIYLNHGLRIDKELPESVPLKLSSVDIYRNDKTPYEEVLLNILDGSRINFSSFREIVESWKVVKKIEKLKQKKKLRFY